MIDNFGVEQNLRTILAILALSFSLKSFLKILLVLIFLNDCTGN